MANREEAPASSSQDAASTAVTSPSLRRASSAWRKASIAAFEAATRKPIVDPFDRTGKVARRGQRARSIGICGCAMADDSSLVARFEQEMYRLYEEPKKHGYIATYLLGMLRGVETAKRQLLASPPANPAWGGCSNSTLLHLTPSGCRSRRSTPE